MFPLQCLGFEVWPVATVLFSNHPGYGAQRGRILEPAEVTAVIEGIGELGVFGRCRAVLSGYLGGADTGPVAAQAAAAVKAANPAAIYCCDPAIGDRKEGLYVPEALAGYVRDELAGHADIIFPNAFELEYLSGMAVADESQALAAADRMTAMGAGLVVATSVPRESGGGGPAIATLAASAAGAWLVTTPLLPLAAKGAGDMLAALFLGHYLLTGEVGNALAAAVSSLFGVIEATAAAPAAELRLVQCREALSAPATRFVAERLR